ncbi:MAG: DUF4835 family protein [Muribaculaceae bacterium]|nr:DUF4835 family protein [Muribaculaceae bacterium]
MFKRIFIYSLLIISSLTAARGQELNCRVEVNSSQIEGTNKSVFQTLQTAIQEYMNTTTFTNAQFAANEKIDCQLYFTIKEYTDGVMKGDLQIQSTRPVYNSAYTTTLINFRDAKIDFQYEEGNPLVYNVNAMEGQLTAILDFYAFLILAVDFDTFSLHGGDPYYDRLKQIVQWGQSSGEIGWKAFEDNNNRSAVLSALTDPQTSMVRKLLYNYHRKGLDEMALSTDKARGVINESLKDIEAVYKAAPMSVVLSMFRDAKMDELVNIYSKAPANERTDAYNLLQPIYPAENQRLDKIKKGQEEK